MTHPATGEGKGRGLLGQIGAVAVITGLSQVFFLLASLVLGRALPPAEFGRLDLANKTINLAAFLGLLGLHSAVLRFLPRRDLPRYDWPAVFRPASLLAGLVAATAGLLVGGLYGFTPLATAMIVGASFTWSLSILGASLLTIDRRFVLAQLLQYLWRPLLLVAALLLLLGGRLGTDAILSVYFLSGLLQVVGVAWALRGTPRGAEPMPTGRLLREGALFFGLFLTSTLMLRLDAFLLAGLVDTAALGRYAAVANIALTGYGVVSLGVSQVISPRVVSGEALPVRRLLVLLILAGGAAGALLSLVGTPLVEWLYGGRYRGPFTLLFVLFCLTGLLQVVYVFPSAWVGLRGSERLLRFFLAVNVVSVAINVGLNLLLIPRWGLEGAALATLLSWLWRLAWAAGLAARIPPAGRSQTAPLGPESDASATTPPV